MKINSKVKFFLTLAKFQTVLNRRFDSGLGGLSFNEFIILYQLSIASQEKLRRIDLAEKIGLSASGVTRLLLPMEKIGLIKSAENEGDARVRYVGLANGGKRKLSEAMERIELLANDILMDDKENAEQVTEFLLDLTGRLYR